jgi:YbgC/YbaW family acyl-CoA thioester hydrolase
MLFRTLLHWLFHGRLGPKLGFAEVSRSHFRVMPTDLDVLRHVNNGVYLSIMDVARFDMLRRNGVMVILHNRDWYPVVVSETISFRKSLQLWQKFTIESKMLGFDAQAVFLEQRFVRPGVDGAPEIYARAVVRARFLKKTGGVVPIEDAAEAAGVHLSDFTVSDELLAWAETTRLPSTRGPAPSIWDTSESGGM